MFHQFAFRTLVVLLMGLWVLPASARDRTVTIYAFRNYKRPEPIRMILVGEIRSKIKVATPRDSQSPFLGYDTRLDQVTVKVINRKGLKVGQKLYVIDKNPYHKKYKNGLIVGEIEVRSILQNPFYGWVVTGTGILLRVREGMFVARTLETENLERAYEKKKKGDYYYNRGDLEKAIASYTAALEADRALPEAHAALGRLYLDLARERRGYLPVRALGEFKEAWRNRGNFRYKLDKYRFYLDYMDALFLKYDVERVEMRGRRMSRAQFRRSLSASLDEIVMVAREAETLQPRGTEVARRRVLTHYLKMRLYKRGDPDYRREAKETGELLAALLKMNSVDAESHRVAFLYYYDLYLEIIAEPNAVAANLNRLLPMFTFGNDFKRWADVNYNRPTRGLDAIRRLLRYHGEEYQRYRRGRPDPAVTNALRGLRPR